MGPAESQSVRNLVRNAFLAFRRALEEFLLVPTGIIVAFLALAFGTYHLDSLRLEFLLPFRDFLRSHVFANSEATSGLLEAIAAGIITLTSITISLLLVAVQQSAGSMTGQVFDQFLRRRMNQIYFGFFVGLALFSLVTLATVNEPFNPVFGASIAFCGTVIALYLLLLLLYTTIHQMRPDEIIDAIHGHILLARARQSEFIAQTRPKPAVSEGFDAPVVSEVHGYLTRVNLDLISKVLDGADAEIVLMVSIGDFVGYRDTIAIVRSGSHQSAEKIAKAVIKGIELERERDIAYDPAYGVTQLETIAWTSISTSKSNPAPGLSVIRSLRDIMSRWSEEKLPERRAKAVAVVYHDRTFETLLDSFETLAVVASESMQHQSFTEIMRTFVIILDRIPESRIERLEDLLLRSLSVLGEFALTRELEQTLRDLQGALQSSGRVETARAVEKALERMSRTIGELGSRATRANS